ncbi:MAG: helix-turn-helix domain-containing protein [Alloprevotella sp.]|nr:helix-turn-helix domain-containing protein [Alloprevotella sp.]
METTIDIPRISLGDVETGNPMVAYSDGDVAFFTTLGDTSPVYPKQMDCYLLVFCAKGDLQFTLGGERFRAHSGQLVICPPRTIVQQELKSADLQCRGILISDRLLRSLVYRQLDYWNRAVFIRKTRVLTLPPASRNAISGFYSLGQYVISERRGLFHREIRTSYLRIMLLELCAILTQQEGGEGEADAGTFVGQGGARIFNNFLQLLSDTECKRRGVADYASDLSVTAKYLSAVCRQQSGRTALEWIQEYITEDIRYLLRSTDMPIKEIADRLGFPNISFFGRYCRRQLGQSPRSYRMGEN